MPGDKNMARKFFSCVSTIKTRLAILDHLMTMKYLSNNLSIGIS